MSKYDPAVILALVLVAITLAVMGLLLASRSCIQDAQEVFSSLEEINADAGPHYAHTFGAAQPLPPQEYVAFEDLVRGLDLGTGVTVGMGDGEVRKVLGSPFTSARIDRSRIQLMYNLPYGCEGAGEKQRLRTRSGFKAMVNMAMLTLTICNGTAESLDISFVAVSSRDGWPFLTLGDKELGLCTPADVRAYFGEPTDSLSGVHDTWHYRLAQPDDVDTEGESSESEDAAAEEQSPDDPPPDPEPAPADEAAPAGRHVAVKVGYSTEDSERYVYEIELALFPGE